MPNQKTYSSEKEIKEVWKLFKENEQRMKETDQQMKETDRKMKETDRRIKYLNELFTGQWGKLMESLVEGDLVRLLKEKNIQVERTLTHLKGKHQSERREFDIIAVNGSEVVVVEVKTTLTVKDVDYFKTKMNEFTDFCPEYKEKKIYGSVAYLKANQSSDKYAEKQGMFVIQATGKSAIITNAPHFKPKVFCS